MKLGKLLGEGNTALVYQWNDGQVIKLFHLGYPKEAVYKEFHNAQQINKLNFPKATAYEIINYNEQLGIVYDQLKGESLGEWVLRTGDIPGCAKHMAELHQLILDNEIEDAMNYKDFLRESVKSLSKEDQREALSMIDNLEDGKTLCHGDFHPWNIFIYEEKCSIIDFMNICRGNYLYDIARTVYLVGYTPVPQDLENREQIIELKKALAELYLKEMNVTPLMINDYLEVIKLCRKGECPDEVSTDV